MTLEELNIKFTAQTSGLTSQLNGVKQQLSGLDNSAAKTGISFGKMMGVGAAVAAVVVGTFAKVGKEALLMANDAVESEQLFEVSMDKMESKARSWSDTLSKSLGLNAIEVRKNVGTMNVMLLSMGMTEDAAYDMSTGLTELANDMASFYNIDTQDAMGKLQSGITGMGMPLKQLGILVDEEIIKEYAMRKGISKTGKEMSQQQKVLARYGAIMEQTNKAQGDLARTMESPTNQIRQLNAQLDAAKIALGTALQPALIAILPSLTKLAVGAGNVLNAMNAAGSKTRSAFGDVGLSVQEASDAIKGAIMGKTESLVAEILAAKDAVNDAIDGYGEAATETKKVLLLMELEPKTTGYDRIAKTLVGFKTNLETTLEKGITIPMTAYLDMLFEKGKINSAQLLKRKEELRKDTQNILDKAAAFELKIQGMVDLAMEDDVITSAESEAIIKEIEAAQADIVSDATKMQAVQLRGLELDLSRFGAENREEIEAAKKDVFETFQTLFGVVDGIAVKLKMEVTQKDWGTPSITPEDREKLSKIIEKEINSGMAIVVKANSILKPTWLGTGAIGDAITAMYDAGVQRAQGSADELQAAVNKWLETGTTADFDLVQSLREKLAADIAYIQGGANIKGRVESALFTAGKNMSPENVKAVTAAYAQGLEELKTAEAAIREERKAQVFGFVGTDQFDSILEYYGVDGLEGAISAIEKLESDSLAMAANNTLEAFGKIAESMGKAFENASASDMAKYFESINDMLDGVDFDSLSEEAKDGLRKIFEAFANSPFGGKIFDMFAGSNVGDIFSQLFPEGYQPPEEVAPEPKGTPAINDEEETYFGVANSFDTMSERMMESFGGEAIEAFNKLFPKDVPINVTQNQDPMGGFGGGGSSNITVDVEPAPVTLMLDAYTVARAVLKFIPKVQAQTGKTTVQTINPDYYINQFEQ